MEFYSFFNILLEYKLKCQTEVLIICSAISCAFTSTDLPRGTGFLSAKRIAVGVEDRVQFLQIARISVSAKTSDQLLSTPNLFSNDVLRRDSYLHLVQRLRMRGFLPHSAIRLALLLLLIYHDVQVVLCLAAVLCAVSAGYVAGPAALVRAPSFDSAIIKSDRLGGNFAYSTAESHAYAAISPVVQNVVSPVGVSYTATPIAAPAIAYGAPLAAPAVAYGAPYLYR